MAVPCAKIRGMALSWGMCSADGWIAPDVYEKAAEWYQHVQVAGMFAISILLPFVLDGAAGVLCISSTAASCRQDTINDSIDGVRGIHDPGWYHFGAWFFPGLVMHNFSGMRDEITGGIFLGDAQSLFTKKWAERGMEQIWKRQYLPLPGEPYFQSLWRMLFELGTRYWMVYTSGLSYHAYRGLDCYIRTYSMPVREPEFEAWYLLNTELPWYRRRSLEPQEWWNCRVWVSHGQRAVTFNWVLNRLTGVVLHKSRM